MTGRPVAEGASKRRGQLFRTERSVHDPQPSANRIMNAKAGTATPLRPPSPSRTQSLSAIEGGRAICDQQAPGRVANPGTLGARRSAGRRDGQPASPEHHPPLTSMGRPGTGSSVPERGSDRDATRGGMRVAPLERCGASRLTNGRKRYEENGHIWQS